jgi:hypothetical protein
MTYALGRRLESTDMLAIRDRTARPQNTASPRLSCVVEAQRFGRAAPRLSAVSMKAAAESQ